MTAPVQERRSAARILLAIFAAALAVRLLNILLLPGGEAGHFVDDSPGYWRWAARLLTEGWFGWWNGDGTSLFDRRSQTYLYFLGAVRLLFGDAPAAAAAVQAVLDAATCAMIAWLGARLDRRIGILAGAAAALWPNMIVISALIITDTVFLFLFTAMLCLCVRFLETGGWRWALAAGLLFGAALTTRSVIQFLVPAMLVAAAALPAYRGRGWRGSGMAVAGFAIGMMMLPGPVLYRNMTHFDAFALTAQTGPHLLNWVVPPIRFAADGTPPSETRADNNRRFEADWLARQGKTRADLNQYRLSREMSLMARAELAELPKGAVVAAWATGAAMNLAAPPLISDPRVRALDKPSFSETPGATIQARIANYLFADIGAYQIVLLTGLGFMALALSLQGWGVLLLVRRRPWAAFYAGGLILYFLLANGPVAAPKYRLPMEPALIVFAAAGLLEAFFRLSGRGKPHWSGGPDIP